MKYATTSPRDRTLSDAVRSFGIALLLTAATCVSAFAQASARTITLHFQPEKTRIDYTAGSALHRVHGTFALKGGQVAFDPSTGVAQGQILVDAASGHSNDKKLDAKMQNQVLESTKYPEVFFHPEKSLGTLKREGRMEGQPQHLTLIGSFNIHGADHPLKVDAVVTMQGDEATAKAEWDVPYVEWGMKDAGTMLFHARTVHIAMVAHATAEGLAGAKQ